MLKSQRQMFRIMSSVLPMFRITTGTSLYNEIVDAIVETVSNRDSSRETSALSVCITRQHIMIHCERCLMRDYRLLRLREMALIQRASRESEAERMRQMMVLASESAIKNLLNRVRVEEEKESTRKRRKSGCRRSDEWLNHGGDNSNRRYADGEVLINPRTVLNMRQKWSFFAGKDITATPAVADGRVYFPSWNGFLYAVNAFTGALIWKQNLSQLTGLNGTGVVVNVTVSRATPTIAGNLLIVGIYGPAVVIAVDRSNGRLVWSTQLDSRPRTMITMSGTVLLGSFYVGVSSLEEGLPASQCCSFRGSVAKLDLRTGAAVWGSSPSIDVLRRHVYVATGNLYTAPPEVIQCQEKQNNQSGKPTQPDQCTGPDIHFNSILALDLVTGRIVWSRQLGGYDIFYFACLTPNNPDCQLGGYDIFYFACLTPNNPDCPPGPNDDADFGEAPMLLTIHPNGTSHDVVVAVQKSGFAWALDRDNGNITWFKLAGPGSNEGGGIWAGAWVALDVDTGKILWTTANPSNDTTQGPVSVANGVVFTGSMASNGPIYAMDATTGKILWSTNTGSSVYGGVSASYGCIYLGTGYTVGLAKFHPTWTGGTSLFAFCIV
ncbi:hypothetical protein ACLB2K_039061 [Fragaria x ananassa]